MAESCGQTFTYAGPFIKWLPWKPRDLKLYLCKRMSILFIIITHLHRHTSLGLYWHPVLFLSGFHASCECHHKTVFYNTYRWQRRKRWIKTRWQMGGDSPRDPCCSACVTEQQVPRAGRVWGQGRRGVGNANLQRPAPSSALKWSPAINGAVSADTWLAQLRGISEPVVAAEKAIRVSRR